MVNKDKQFALMLKFDFEKAFDRIEHSFLFVVLRNMETKGNFLNKIMSLMDNSYSRVQFNDSYSPKFHIQGGVGQVFPLAPFLFL